VIQSSNRRHLILSIACLTLAGCMATPAVKTASSEPEKLVVSADGKMQLGKRLIPDDDVIIYNDGFGGEKAAVRVRMEPLHPDFFRDSIVVERE